MYILFYGKNHMDFLANPIGESTGFDKLLI